MGGIASMLDDIVFAQLVSLADDIVPQEFVLSGAVHTLGRAPSCDIHIPRGTISRLHARIVRDGPRYVLQDAGSANGTFVNGALISDRHTLANRDTIGLGSAGDLLRFIDPDPTVIPGGRLRFDERTQVFYLSDEALSLPPTQHRLLVHLYRRIGELCPREECAEAIWGRDYDPGMDADALDKIVSGLRGAIRRVDPAAELIQTRRGMGFVLLPTT
ncbi:MAG: FHA domain-containing protein [Oscillochloris sp.]|nr:FHA domain-containing protein [Oscillochloris sp.]